MTTTPDRDSLLAGGLPTQYVDVNPEETREWIESLDALIATHGEQRARHIMLSLLRHSSEKNVGVPSLRSTDYINTISPDREPDFPGDEFIERRIRAYIRWNAAMLVHRAQRPGIGVGGHISTYASSASLYEVGFNHFFRGPEHPGGGDQVFFQGHASPGMYARAFLEGRLSADRLDGFRQELSAAPNGLPSYPHPRLMPDFWQFPTVSMGLGPMNAIYQARFNRYLHHRGIKDTSQQRVWAYLGDGEMDEPESLGAIGIAAREELDNLTFVINCNLQRLDGPVRGNGKIIQELESHFRGAGWNVIKVIWGREWDELLAKDNDGALVNLMNRTPDGDYQTYKTENGGFVRDNFFGRDPRTKAMVEDWTDDKVWNLKRGGHDYKKMYAAYAAAEAHTGQPTVILAKTIKGWTLGLGGYVPSRRTKSKALTLPGIETYKDMSAGSGNQPVATTMAFVRLLRDLVRDKNIGSRIVPIIPDEARTFGMDSFFPTLKIYSPHGQQYLSVDRELMLSYKESESGQILHEGINEAGSVASWTAVATSYATHDEPMIPIYVFYSMFGFQRTGDSLWLAGDQMSRGFVIGATAGRTTLNGEGLQHEDGHSHLLAATNPAVVSYDPAFGFEIGHIVRDGLERMYGENPEDIYYYLTVYNEPYVQPPEPTDIEVAGILRGMYLLSAQTQTKGPRAQLLASGVSVPWALEAQKLLREDWGVSADVWSVTSWNELRRDGLKVDRHNFLNPSAAPSTSWVTEKLTGTEGPVIAVSDFMRAVQDQIRDWVPNDFVSLGTDGWGMSDTRGALRRHFLVDAQSITVQTLAMLVKRGEMPAERVQEAIDRYDLTNPKAASAGNTEGGG